MNVIRHHKVIAKRTKSHLVLFLVACIAFAYPCIFIIDGQAPTFWNWAAKGFLVCFLIPVGLLSAYQMKFQLPAIELKGQDLVFATMLPWGRSTVPIADIIDCRADVCDQSFDHLVLIVSAECFEIQNGNSAWLSTSDNELRFNMEYCDIDTRNVAQTIRSLVGTN